MDAFDAGGFDESPAFAGAAASCEVVSRSTCIGVGSVATLIRGGAPDIATTQSGSEPTRHCGVAARLCAVAAAAGGLLVHTTA